MYFTRPESQGLNVVIRVMQQNKTLITIITSFLIATSASYLAANSSEDTWVLSDDSFKLSRETVEQTTTARGFSYQDLDQKQRNAFLQELFIRENLLRHDNILPSEKINQLNQKVEDYRESQQAKMVLDLISNLGMPDFSVRAQEVYLANKKEKYSLPLRLRVKVLMKSLNGDKDAVLRKLEAIRKQVLNGEQDFTVALMEYSDDTNRKLTEGDSFWFHKGQKPDFFFAAAEKLNDQNKLSDVLVAGNAAFLLEFIDRQEARVQPFDEVREEITAELQDDYRTNQRNRIVAELKNRFEKKIRIHPDYQ